MRLLGGWPTMGVYFRDCNLREKNVTKNKETPQKNQSPTVKENPLPGREPSKAMLAALDAVGKARGKKRGMV
jgi:hypothetical protein